MGPIALYRPGKTRESTVATAEQHKSAIRRYMDSLGYGQQTDAFTEGHLADQIYSPLDERLDRRDVWVESKATHLSASDTRFVQETRKYLREWLQRAPAERFHFRIFASGLKNPNRWEELFGSKITQAALRTWLEPDQTEDETDKNSFTEFPEKSADIVTFFVDTILMEADVHRLGDLTETRKRMGIASNEARARARKMLGLLEERSKPLFRKSILYANFLEFEPPSQYDVLEVDLHGEAWFERRLPRFTPPWILLEKGRILTIASETSQDDFKAINATRIDSLDLETLMEAHGEALHKLHCEVLYQIANRAGIRTHPRVSFFIAYREVEKRRSRIIEVDGGELSVATPYYPQRPKETSVSVGEGLVQYDPAKSEAARYVYHEGFHIDCVNLWGRFFARIHLQRCYTHDGFHLLDGRATARLDKSFRNPQFNRSESQLRKVRMIGHYLFRPNAGFDAPEWRRNIRFKGFFNFPTPWTPESVEMRQALLGDDGEWC